MFTREAAQETPEEGGKQYLKTTKFDNFTFKEESCLDKSFDNN
jgi:hypothetical protein